MREIRDTETQKTKDKDLGEATEQQAAVQIQKVMKLGHKTSHTTSSLRGFGEGCEHVLYSLSPSLKVWKGYIQRKRTKQEREEEMIFLGMVS